MLGLLYPPFYEHNFWKMFLKKAYPPAHLFIWSERERLEQIHVFQGTDATSPIYLFSIAFSVFKIRFPCLDTLFLNILKCGCPTSCNCISKPFLSVPPQRLTFVSPTCISVQWVPVLTVGALPYSATSPPCNRSRITSWILCVGIRWREENAVWNPLSDNTNKNLLCSLKSFRRALEINCLYPAGTLLCRGPVTSLACFSY